MVVAAAAAAAVVVVVAKIFFDRIDSIQSQLLGLLQKEKKDIK